VLFGIAGSGVFGGAKRSRDDFLVGTCRDFALFVAGDFDPSTLLFSTPRWTVRIDRHDFWLSALDLRPPKLGLRLMSISPEASGVTNVPGPTDFLGGFVVGAVLLNAFGGKWLCRRPRVTDVVVVDIGSPLADGRLALEAAEFLRPKEAGPETFLVGIGRAGCVGSLLCSGPDTAGTAGACLAPALPGSGKLFRLGSGVLLMLS